MTSSKPSVAGPAPGTEPCLVLMKFIGSLGDLLAGGVVLVHPFGRSRILGQGAFGPGRPLHQVAAAVRAGAAQAAVRAICAEGAFEGADQRVRSAVRQVLVAAF